MNLENPGEFTILEFAKKVLAKPIQILKLHIVLFHMMIQHKENLIGNRNNA